MVADQKAKKKEGQDLFRDSPFRYMGYANEIGEALRPFIGARLVNLSYMISSSYVLADTGAKASDQWRLGGDKKEDKAVKTLKKAVDVLLWQSFASIIIPGIAINRLVALTHFIAVRTTLKPGASLISSAAGLVAIPYIVHPIDEFVDEFMDKYIRPTLNGEKDKNKNKK